MLKPGLRSPMRRSSLEAFVRAMYGTGFQQVGPAVSSVSSATQAEGTSLVHTVTLASAVSGTDGKYAFNLTAGTASTPSDYTATPTFSNSVTLSGGVLTVPIAVTTFTITVATTDDSVYEGSEAYSVTVGNVTNTGTITDNESAPTIASVSSASATEGSNIVHTVAVTGTAQASRTFALAFSGAAVGGTDYNATPTFSAGVTLSGGNITVPAGVTSFTVTVSTINNASADGSRAYTLTIGGASGTGTVNDDEVTIYDVVLLAGQSNMSGRGTYDAGIDTTDAAVSQFGGYASAGTYQTIFAGSDPLTMPDFPAVGVGPGMFFGKRHHTLTGRNVLLVPCAVGGTSIIAGSVTWNPYGSGSSDYNNAIDQANLAVTAAIAAYPGSSFTGTLWLQGEGDGANSVSQATYQQALADLIAGFRAGITGGSSSWFVLGQMMPEAIAAQGGTYSAIDAAHTAIGSYYPMTAKASIGTGYNSGDNLHYNAAGARLMGTTMADLVATAAASAGEASPGQVTGLTTGTVTSSSVPLTWTAPGSGTVRDYQIQYALAGSGSWTTYVDGTSTTASTTVSGLSASTSYDFRVRAVNYNTTPGAWSSTATVSTATSGLTDAFVQLTAITGTAISQSGNSSVGYTYTIGSGAAFVSDHAGTSDKKMAAGVDGSIRAVYTTPGVDKIFMLGLVKSQTNPAYNAGASGYTWGVFNHSTGVYKVIVDGGSSGVDCNGTVTSFADGDIVRLVRSSGTIVAQVARTATPTTWITLHTFATTYTNDVWAAISANSSAASVSIGPLIGNGWA